MLVYQRVRSLPIPGHDRPRHRLGTGPANHAQRNCEIENAQSAQGWAESFEVPGGALVGWVEEKIRKNMYQLILCDLFIPNLGGHLTFWRGHLTISNRSRLESPGRQELVVFLFWGGDHQAIGIEFYLFLVWKRLFFFCKDILSEKWKFLIVLAFLAQLFRNVASGTTSWG